MARKARICLPNLTYHVSSRCIELRDMITQDCFKEILIDVMRVALEKYDFELVFYEIMDNHFHFIIRTVDDGESISRIMQYVKSRFAEKYNRLMNRTGPFWNERFKDEIIDFYDHPSLYLRRLLWKLAFNPVRKNKSKDPRKYKYGCINVYLEESYESPLKITYHRCFLDLGTTFQERMKRFLYYENNT